MNERFELVERFGRKLQVYQDRPMSLYQLLLRTVELHQDQTALVHDNRSISYRQLVSRVDLVAEHLLHSWHLKKGDRIGVLLPNRPEFCELLLAAAKIGVIAVLLNTRLTAQELSFMVEHSGCKLFFFDEVLDDAANKLRQKFSNIRFVSIDATPDSLVDSYETVVSRHLPVTCKDSVEETDPCYIMYTSGTTGRPKGAVTCHMNVIHSAINYSVVCGTSEMDRTLIAIPLFHVSGLIGQLIHMLLVGGTSVLVREYSTRDFMETAVQTQITFMFNVPAIYNLLLMHKEEACQITTLRLALYGGAPIAADTIMSLKSLFPGLQLQNAYGATETSSPATLMPKDWAISKVVSVGRPVPGCICKVIREDGKECESEEVGELWIHGAMIIPEYWENEAANRSSFERGFWKSGDMATIDKDGYVYIVDRKKDIINRGGEKIYSVEVENVLYSHPKILEAAVIGVQDEIFGEQVKAFVVPVEHETITSEEVMEFVKSHLAHFKTPKYVEFLQGLPRNPGGKVMKHTLREEGSNR